MYCVSADRARINNANEFSVSAISGAMYYNQKGNAELSKSYYAIFCGSMLMEAFETEQGAKEKLKEVLNALTEDVEVFEF